MVFSEFKQLAEIKAAGSKKLPANNTVWGLLIQESMLAICNKTIAIDLLETDPETADTYRWVSPSQFVRYPNKPIDDGDKIDIDEQLHNAVLYDFLFRHLKANKNNDYMALRDEQISDYEWSNYAFIKNLETYTEET